MNTQVTDLPKIQSDFQPRPLSMSAVRGTPRLAYLDTLRAVLVVLVILFHTAITYGALGDFTFIDPTAKSGMVSTLLTLFVVLCQAFFMGLFFFISGYFTPGSIDRKGLAHFWKDRLLRLGLPFLAYTFVLSKVPNYLSMLRAGKAHLSFLEFSRINFFQAADAGPTWFLCALLVFSLGYSLWCLVAPRLFRPGDVWAALPVPGKGTLIGLALVIAASMFAVCQVWPMTKPYRLFNSITLMLAFFPQYILLYIAGILAYRNDWLARLPASSLKFWARLAGFLAIVIGPILALSGGAGGNLDPFFSGLHWQSLTLNLWAGLYCVSISLTLLLWLRDRRPTQSRLMSTVAASSFSIYLIHPLVLVPISFAVSYLDLYPLVKFVGVGLLAVTGSFALGIALRRIPGLKAVL